jgi:hypothetical protein
VIQLLPNYTCMNDTTYAPRDVYDPSRKNDAATNVS